MIRVGEEALYNMIGPITWHMVIIGVCTVLLTYLPEVLPGLPALHSAAVAGERDLMVIRSSRGRSNHFHLV